MNNIINDVIKTNRDKIFEYSSIQEFCYWYIVDVSQLNCKNINDLQGEEEVLAAKGYKNIKPDLEDLEIIEKPKKSKIAHYSQDKYKLIGICLASEKTSQAYNYLKEFVKNSTINELFLVQKFYPEFKQEFELKLTSDIENNTISNILKYIFLNKFENEIQNFISELIKKDLETIDLLVLNELQDFYSTKAVQKTTYKNISARDIIVNILENFANAVIKIIDPKERYGGKTPNPKKTPKSVISIEDEYDVQDILYIILKSIFPDIKYEDNTSSYGGSAKRLDFYLQSEGVIIEVKQINTADDKKYTKQMKEDLQSYHVVPTLNEIIFFIYAPKAIQDANNFHQLQGEQTVQGKKFGVKVILVQ